MGSVILIFGVILYLDGFTAFYNFLKTYRDERKRKNQEDELDSKDKGGGGLDGTNKKRSDMDT